MMPLKRSKFFTTAVFLCLWFNASLILSTTTARSAEARGTVGKADPHTDQHSNQPQDLDDILKYISNGWNSLTRSMTNCMSVADTKSAEKPVLYLPAQFPVPAAVQQLEKDCSVRVKRLPSVIKKLGQIDASRIHPPGLLYLE